MSYKAKDEIVELEMVRHFVTERAIRVSKHGEDSSAVWLPISQIDVSPMSGNRVLVTIPVWLATDKGLV